MAIVFFGEPDTHGVSDALQVLDGSGLYVRTANGEELGVVRPDGTSITIDPDGTIHGGASTVPVATTSTAGKVRPDGTSITVDPDGTIHGSLAQITWVGDVSNKFDASSGYYYADASAANLTPSAGTAIIVRLTYRSGTNKLYLKVNDDNPSRVCYYDDHDVMWPDIPLYVPTLIVYDGSKWTLVGESDRPSNQFMFCTSNESATQIYKYVDARFTEIAKGMALVVTFSNDNAADLSSIRLGCRTAWSGGNSAALIRKDGEVLTENLRANTPYLFVFDGTYWELVGVIGDIATATESVAGKVKPDGTSITIDPDGTIHGGASTVPVATTSTAGKVRPDGTTIDVDASGTISVIGASGPHWEVRTDPDGNRRLAIVIPEVD